MQRSGTLKSHVASENEAQTTTGDTYVDPSKVKKRRLSTSQNSINSDDVPKRNKPIAPFRTPLRLLEPSEHGPGAPQPQDNEDGMQYAVLWRRRTNKKHKTWEGDGFLHVIGGSACLRDTSGRHMSKATCNKLLTLGSTLAVQTFDVEVASVIHIPHQGVLTESEHPNCPNESLKKDRSDDFGKTRLEESSIRRNKHFAPVSSGKHEHGHLSLKSVIGRCRAIAPIVPDTRTAKSATPMHDPLADGALVMPKMPKASEKGPFVDVVVDPFIARHLREHQRSGIQFLYECVTGLRDHIGQGAILADEMGLGKTLQVIALIWTLIKQTPIVGSPPMVKKVLIVCPVTLIHNWQKEFRRWLGPDRLGVYVFDDNKKRVTDFSQGKSYSVMIVGYEKLRSIVDDLKGCIDLVIADEGHRLKTAKNKSLTAICSLETSRRVILSGTPLQNDLTEFFTLADFVNPGVLGHYGAFQRSFERPIGASRQPSATHEEEELGALRSDELYSMTRDFILRRTTEVLSQHLPPKTEYILFCRPTSSQAFVYQKILSSVEFQAAADNPEMALRLINVLKKVCNSPFLLRDIVAGDSHSQDISERPLIRDVPAHHLQTNQGSSKMRVLDQFLHAMRTTTEEKLVLVSNYTSTLNIIEQMLASLGISFLRLDGSTPPSKRQKLVDRFNRVPASKCFAFILSAKAGGLGLNLVGASRLIMFDVDWNPATDLQAIARIHRDGQKRHCKIYRFLLTGGIDEKIWQRQATKLDLASNIMECKGSVNSFTRDQLRDLFRLEVDHACPTHDLLRCGCNAGNSSKSSRRHEDCKQEEPCKDQSNLHRSNSITEPSMHNHSKRPNQKSTENETARRTNDFGSLMAYKHVDVSNLPTEHDVSRQFEDKLLTKVLNDEDNRISYVFYKAST